MQHLNPNMKGTNLPRAALTAHNHSATYCSGDCQVYTFYFGALANVEKYK